MNVHLATLQLKLVAPTATELSVQLPAGRLTTSTILDERTDSNIGDTEIRLKQTIPWWERPRLDVGIGLVLPTGPYVAKSGAANLAPEASFITLGRGVPWGIAEIQASIPLSDSFSAYVQLSGRIPLTQTDDEFDWGNEARTVIGGQMTLLPRLSALGIVELQWRGTASEPNPFSEGARAESANAGGTWWTMTPAVSYAATERISVLGGLRVPIHSNVKGNQLVPGTGGFIAVSSSLFSVPPTPPHENKPTTSWEQPTPTLGKITIIDYWATWCAPCADIDKALRAAEPRWTDVEIIRVDSSLWPDIGKLPEGATGLPVIEIYNTLGERTHLLTGNEALQVVDTVNTLQTNKQGTPL